VAIHEVSKLPNLSIEPIMTDNSANGGNKSRPVAAFFDRSQKIFEPGKKTLL
jgi:hypothetical protein